MNTHESWVSQGQRLLADKTEWTALYDAQAETYFVLRDDVICTIPKESAEQVYSEEDIAGQTDASAWSYDGKSWDGSTPEQTRKVLESPIFVELPHQEAPKA